MQQAVMQHRIVNVKSHRAKWMGIVMLLLLSFLMALSTTADAKRFGGGSFGRKAPGVTQRNAAQPAQRNANQTQSAKNPQQAGQTRKPWGGMLGGLAAGLGLAALFHMLGFGPEMGEIMGTLLMVFLAIVAISFVLRMLRRAGQPQASGASASGNSHRNVFEQLNPSQASANQSMPFQGAQPIASGGNASWGRMEIPEGLDAKQFEDVAKANFVRLQKAWDANDLASLRAFLTDEMYGIMEKRQQGELRNSSHASQSTEIVMLNAELLGVQDMGDEYMASVEFTGMLRESPEVAAESFTEVWNLTKDKNGPNSGWLLAGIQQV